MTTYELLSVLTKLSDALAPKGELYQLLFQMTTNFEKAVRAIDDVINTNDPSTALNHAKTLRDVTKGVIDETNAFGPSRIVVGLNDWVRELEPLHEEMRRSELRQLSLDGSDELDAVAVLMESGRNLLSRYDSFLKNQVASEVLMLMLTASVFVGTVRNTYAFVSAFRNHLLPSAKHGPNERELSIFLSMTSDLGDVLRKLHAIDGIYEELCFLLSVSTSEYPLRVIKVEVGSLWTQLIGESRVVGLLISQIERYIDFLYRNRTDEGRLNSLNNHVETARNLLKLEEELQNAGIDTSDLRENLEKAGVTISQKLNDLLPGQTRVDINDQSYDSAEWHASFLREPRTLFLGTGEANDSDSHDNSQSDE